MEPPEPARLCFRTARLHLRDLEERDLPGILAYHADPRVARWVLPSQRNPQRLRAELLRDLGLPKTSPRLAYCFALTLDPADPAIGRCAVTAHQDVACAALGWDLEPEHWGRGYMTEAVRAVLEFAFLWRDLEWAYADCYPNNRASIRVMEKVGMAFQPLTIRETLALSAYYRRWPVVRHVFRREWLTAGPATAP